MHIRNEVRVVSAYIGGYISTLNHLFYISEQHATFVCLVSCYPFLTHLLSRAIQQSNPKGNIKKGILNPVFRNLKGDLLL